MQRGLGVERLFHYYGHTGELQVEGRNRGFSFSSDELDSVFGFILCTAALHAHDLLPLTKQLLAHGRPVAIIDEVGGMDVPSPLPINAPPVSQFPVGTGTGPGLLMGRFLISLGHRRIAYISDAREQQWSRNRLCGLDTAFEQAGFTNAVTPVTVCGAAQPPSVSRAEHAELGAVVRACLSKADTRNPRLQTLIEAACATPDLPARLAVTLAQSHAQAVVETSTVSSMQPLLESKEITAWVGANDAIAALALEHIVGQGRRVPHDISVVGFDATEAASHMDLTTYNFNLPAIVEAAVEHVLNPPSRNRHGSHVCTREIGGFVIPRNSTARAEGCR